MESIGRSFVISSKPAESKPGALAPQTKGQIMRDRIMISVRRSLAGSRKNPQTKFASQFSYWRGALAAVLLTLSGGPAFGMDATIGGALPAPLPLFPADNWWNLDISAWPVDPNSASYISFINNGGTRHLHPDFG